MRKASVHKRQGEEMKALCSYKLVSEDALVLWICVGSPPFPKPTPLFRYLQTLVPDLEEAIP